MISVSIFILRDVIWTVQMSYKIPHNGKSHTSPSTDKDIQEIRDYLEKNSIQTFNSMRDGQSSTTPARDLFAEGVKYLNSASAFKNFKPVVSKAKFKSNTQLSTPTSNGDAEPIDDETEDADDELDTITMDEIQDDDEEFFPGTDLADTIANMTELMGVLAQYD